MNLSEATTRLRLTDGQRFELYTHIAENTDKYKSLPTADDIYRDVMSNFDYLIAKTTVVKACKHFGIVTKRKKQPTNTELKQAVKILSRCVIKLSEELAIPCDSDLRKILDKF